MKKSSIENVKEVDNSASCGVVVYPFKEFKNQIKNIWLAHFPNNEPQKFQFSARIPIKDKFTLEHLKDNNINKINKLIVVNKQGYLVLIKNNRDRLSKQINSYIYFNINQNII